MLVGLPIEYINLVAIKLYIAEITIFIYVITKMLKDSQVRFYLPMTDSLSRPLNQSYGQVPEKKF